jgi:peroxiredoxin
MKLSRRAVLGTLAAGPASLGAALAAPAAPGEAVRWPAVTLLDGTRWEPATAQAVVVVFWSVACPFCKRHNAHVDKLHRATAGKGLAVLGVSSDHEPRLVRGYMATNGYGFPNTMDRDALAAALSMRRIIPLTVTIDRQGHLKQVIPGEMFEEDVMELQQLAG